MIHITGLQDANGNRCERHVEGERDLHLDGAGLTLLPAGIDPHVHFRTPGAEHKENWTSAARAALSGGYTTVLDMPNTSPPVFSVERVEAKEQLIREQLEEAGIPLRFQLYLGADCDHLEEISRASGRVCGLKIYMGSSTGNLVMEEEAALDRAFFEAAQLDLVVAVHAEDEKRLRRRAEEYAGREDPALHSLIRDPEAARLACAQAIELAAKHGTKLYIAHLSTRGELELVREAKKSGVTLFAEATPHHLFLDTSAYAEWGTQVQVNPPLRSPEDREALWDALQSGLIDTVGSDHAPHTLEEKQRPFGQAPSGVPGIEHTFPLLLTEVVGGRLTMQRFIEVTHTRVREIFTLPDTDDWTLVDLDSERKVRQRDVQSRCGWTPYATMRLRGWPAYTCVQNTLFRVGQGVVEPITSR